MELDFIKEQILSIEDFDNVDKKLMEKINSSEEYRRLFEELRELSALAADCVPVPERNGVSLHDAVMDRVKKGDTYPKYIISGRKYPFVTAACLLLCFAVAFAARNGLFGKMGIKGFDGASNESAVYDMNTADEETIEYEAEYEAEYKTEAYSKESGGGSFVYSKMTTDGAAPKEDSGLKAKRTNGTKDEPQAQMQTAQCEPEEQMLSDGMYGTSVSSADSNDAEFAETDYYSNTVNSSEISSDVKSSYISEVLERYIPGGDVDSLEPLYDVSFDLWQFKSGTFADTPDCLKYVDEYDKLSRQETDEQLFPIMRYLTDKMKLTRAELETYYGNSRENVIEALLEKDRSRAMQLMKSPFAFYCDGRLYNVHQLYSMYSDGELSFSVNDDSYDDEWALVYAYMKAEQDAGIEYDSGLCSFIENNYSISQK